MSAKQDKWKFDTVVAQDLSVARALPFEGLWSEVLMVTPALAVKLRENCHFERQRNISHMNVARLSFEMERETFVRGTPIFMCVLPNGSLVIVNGNHTLESVVSAGVSIPLTFIYLRVADLDEAGRAYAKFDIQRRRHWIDRAKAVGVSQNTQNLSRLLPAVGHIISGFEFRQDAIGRAQDTSDEVRFAGLEEYREAATLMSISIDGKTEAHRLKRAAVLSVALYCFKHQPSAADEFWGGVAANDGLKVGDPRKKLLSYLTSHKASTSHDRGEQSKACALAWNAWFEGRELRHLQPGQNKQLFILGTPWHKGPPDGSLPKAEPVPAPVVQTEPETAPEAQNAPEVADLLAAIEPQSKGRPQDPKPLRDAIQRNLEAIKKARGSGASWEQIAKALAQAGVVDAMGKAPTSAGCRMAFRAFTNTGYMRRPVDGREARGPLL